MFRKRCPQPQVRVVQPSDLVVLASEVGEQIHAIRSLDRNPNVDSLAVICAACRVWTRSAPSAPPRSVPERSDPCRLSGCSPWMAPSPHRRPRSHSREAGLKEREDLQEWVLTHPQILGPDVEGHLRLSSIDGERQAAPRSWTAGRSWAWTVRAASSWRSSSATGARHRRDAGDQVRGHGVPVYRGGVGRPVSHFRKRTAQVELDHEAAAGELLAHAGELDPTNYDSRASSLSPARFRRWSRRPWCGCPRCPSTSRCCRCRRIACTGTARWSP